jgi:hypothetical protein
MLDEDMKLQLIEVNSNPCMDRVGPHLKKMLPEMIEHLFQRALDPIFPSPVSPSAAAATPSKTPGKAAAAAATAVAATSEPQVEVKSGSARERAKARAGIKDNSAPTQPGRKNLMQMGAYGMGEFRQQQRLTKQV